MDNVEAKKFVMFRAWWRIKAYDYNKLNNTPETFAYMGFGVEVSKLYF